MLCSEHVRQVPWLQLMRMRCAGCMGVTLSWCLPRAGFPRTISGLETLCMTGPTVSHPTDQLRQCSNLPIRNLARSMAGILNPCLKAQKTANSEAEKAFHGRQNNGSTGVPQGLYDFRATPFCLACSTSSRCRGAGGGRGGGGGGQLRNFRNRPPP